MKILLIGKNGQVGQELDKYINIYGYKSFSFGKKELNILDYELVKQKIEQIKPDVVINTAAFHVVADCEMFPGKAFEVNVSAQKNLAILCRRHKIKLVYYSTDKIFDGKKRKPYSETDSVNPIQIYGLSKLAGEFVTLNYCPESLVIRTCGIFGGAKGSREKKGNFVLYILKQSTQRTEIKISSEQKASFVSAEDLAVGTLQLIKKKKKGVFNVVNSGYASWADFALEIVKIRKLNLKVIPINRHGIYGDVPTPIFTALDNAKTIQAGIYLQHWKKALKNYLSFLSSRDI